MPEPLTPEEWAFHLQSKLDDNSDLPREREMFKKCVHAIRAQAFRERLEKVEKELAEAKQWVEELKASESAELAKLRSDVKPLLKWMIEKSCCVEHKAKLDAFLAAHPEFRKDETK